MTGFILRDIVDPWEMQSLETVQSAAFEYSDRSLLPSTMFRISSATGGIVLGAFAGSELIGYSYGFPAFNDGELWHHSHHLAVLPSWRASGVAVALKLAQRDRALAQGMKRMTWTFDPLVARNARFNMGKLGARAVTYLPEWYALGESRATAFPADRLLVEWDLSKLHTAKPAPKPEGQFILIADKNNKPALMPSKSEDKLLAEVPTQAVSGDLRLEWRMAIREALTDALTRGFVVSDLAREGNAAYYVLTKID